jgi:hypothetical protein
MKQTIALVWDLALNLNFVYELTIVDLDIIRKKELFEIHKKLQNNIIYYSIWDYIIRR